MKNGESRVRLPGSGILVFFVSQSVDQVADKGDNAENEHQRNADAEDPQADHVQDFAQAVPKYPVGREHRLQNAEENCRDNCNERDHAAHGSCSPDLAKGLFLFEHLITPVPLLS